MDTSRIRNWIPLRRFQVPSTNREQKTVLLHIGTHKAASTTIQSGLEINRKPLLVNGWLYPKSGYVYRGQHNIAWQIKDDRRYRAAWGTLRDLLEEIETSGAENVILSSEDFENFSADQVEYLNRELSPHHVAIIVYLRRQDKFLQSFWSQRVKTSGSSLDFESWLASEVFAKEEGEPLLGDYDELLERWARTFGPERIRVRVLEHSQLEGHVFVDFLKTSGIGDDPRFKLPADKNISPSLKTLEITRHTMRVFRKYAGSDDQDLMNKLDRLIRRYADREGWNQQRLNLMTKELYSRISERFARSNARVARKYLGREVLFQEDFEEEPISEFHMHDWNILEAMDFYGFLIAEMRAR
jgi:hypothetical protein